jgi:hypothetical protein
MEEKFKGIQIETTRTKETLAPKTEVEKLTNKSITAIEKSIGAESMQSRNQSTNLKRVTSDRDGGEERCELQIAEKTTTKDQCHKRIAAISLPSHFQAKLRYGDSIGSPSPALSLKQSTRARATRALK